MEGTSRSHTGIISKKSEMPPDLLAKFEAWQTKKSAPNPLYDLESRRFGSFTASYEAPAHARAGNFSKYFLSRKGQLKSTMDTSAIKSNYPTR